MSFIIFIYSWHSFGKMFAFFSTGGNPLKQESMTKVRKQKINGYSLASHENAFRDPPFGETVIAGCMCVFPSCHRVSVGPWWAYLGWESDGPLSVPSRSMRRVPLRGMAHRWLNVTPEKNWISAIHAQTGHRSFPSKSLSSPRSPLSSAAYMHAPVHITQATSILLSYVSADGLRP